LTRRGEPVAVLIGRRQYERLILKFRGFSEAYEDFTREINLAELGIDPDEGTVVIADFVRAGQTVQFQIRDQQTADDEMKQMLAGVRDDPNASPAGAMLFTCNGRGTRLFTEPHHDADVIKNALGEIPLAGFFAAGELGPVGGKNFMHGFTASIALFEPM